MFEIVMQGPGKNALSSGMMDFLLEELRRAAGAPVLLTGHGDAFCAGLDLKEVHALEGAGMQAFLQKLERLVSTLFTYPGPTVAAINGHAIAGGCVLATCCDHRVARADTSLRMGLNEVALGLQFPPGILRMLKLRLTAAQLEQAALGAALLRADEAGALGLLDELTDRELLQVAKERLQARARHPAEAYAATKRELRGASTVHPGDEETLARMVPAWTSPAIKERVAAILRPKGG